MQIITDNNGFRPVTIVVETPEEATRLWLACNFSPTDMKRNFEGVSNPEHLVWSDMDHTYSVFEALEAALQAFKEESKE